MKLPVATSIVIGASLILAGESQLPSPSHSVRVVQGHPVAVTADVDPNAIVAKTCVRCHSDSRLRGNLSLEDFDISRAAENAETIERMIRKGPV